MSQLVRFYAPSIGSVWHFTETLKNEIEKCNTKDDCVNAMMEHKFYLIGYLNGNYHFQPAVDFIEKFIEAFNVKDTGVIRNLYLFAGYPQFNRDENPIRKLNGQLTFEMEECVQTKTLLKELYERFDSFTEEEKEYIGQLIR